jgi:hypothetical protein
MATTDVTFWAYNWYIMNNPHKTNLTRQDIHEMAEMFAAANSTEITSSTDPGGTYTGIEWPDASGGASTITAVGNSSTDITGNVRWDLIDQASKATLDQAQYPEKHRGA